jgi:N-acetylneuraminic acid mutarotase
VRQWAVSFSIGSKGYVGAGFDGSFRKDFWEYDPTTNIWTRKADFGGTGRGQSVGFSIGSKGYMGTGDDGSFRKDFWEYDPASNIWARKADFRGVERRSAVGFSIGSKGYIGVGFGDSSYKDFWEYDPVTTVSYADFGGRSGNGTTAHGVRSTPTFRQAWWRDSNSDRQPLVFDASVNQ